MKIIIDSQITIRDPTPELLQWCNQNMIIDNPAYYKLIRMGKRAWGAPQKIVFYSFDQQDHSLLLPRGVLKSLWDMYPDMALYQNRMVRRDPVRFDSQITLRDYQSPAIEAVKSGKQGIVVMPCGAGKTETALQIIAELGQPALWITHTADLMQQSLDRAISRLGLLPGQYGVIGGGQYTVGTHITFATVQSLKNKDLDSLGWRFGTVVIDECHRAFMSASKMSMFQSVLDRLPALYRIGITASEHRSDGLVAGMYHLLGQRLYQVTQDQLNQSGRIIQPVIHKVHTNYEWTGDQSLEFTAMLCDMAANEKRNQLIAQKITDLLHQNRTCLVLSDRLAQLRTIQDMVAEMAIEYRTEYIDGTVSKKRRQARMNRVKDGTAQSLFASYTIAKEGLDIPRLDALVLATPHRDKVAVQQSVGRIMRPFEGKADAIVYDFVDTRIGVCKSQYNARKKVYLDIGCSFTSEERTKL